MGLVRRARIGDLRLGRSRYTLSRLQHSATLCPKLSRNAAKSGPLIVVDAEHVTAKTKGASLQAFDRKLIVIGGLSAIVPVDMVLIDESYREPNLYDGLPLQSKVLYLLSTLLPAQAGIANSQGIGLSDLEGEQIKVLKSILPPTLPWKTVKVDKFGTEGVDLDHNEVPADQMDEVRLKIQRGSS